ncbi:hypothetical protein MP638_006985 [Amoeboaphelidium occidentale]|nr:hypothetical protein MP638_003991 [Amoeboaphelidium occidentale]KAI3655483.1 hypothetical protein MP638_006985 [Amoeboaphelidium occidentale]
MVGASEKRTVTGTFKVIDGCTFEISGFTLKPSALSTYFYASSTISDTVGKRINKDLLGAYDSVTVRFNLTGEFGNSGREDQFYSWDQINVVKIVSDYERAVLGYAILNEAGVTDLDKSSGSSLNGNQQLFLAAMLMALGLLLIK